MADITTKTVSSLTSDSTLSETDAFVYGDAGGNTLKKSALSVLRNALFGATTLPSSLATTAKNVIGAINELNTKITPSTITLNTTWANAFYVPGEGLIIQIPCGLHTTINITAAQIFTSSGWVSSTVKYTYVSLNMFNVILTEVSGVTQGNVCLAALTGTIS